MAKVHFTAPKGKGNPGGQNPGKAKAKGGQGAGAGQATRHPRQHMIIHVQHHQPAPPAAAPAAPATPPPPARQSSGGSGGDGFWRGMLIGLASLVAATIVVWFLACMGRPYPNAPLASAPSQSINVHVTLPSPTIVQPVVQQPAVVEAPPQQAEVEYEPAPVAPVVYERPSAGRTIGAFLGGVAAGAIIDRFGHRSGGYRGYSSRGYGGGYRTPNYGGGYRRGRR